ncbi:uncharacterized protein [Glycine max]|uniref:uncharacterized protein n=1 Tax=Glycine max TaxID=3847 RepID=UPI0003DE7A4C|nr:uncharacterized protein LOC102659596 [Glycine max]|eukprot:XP_006593260.1 uncharacterized protein LOC102659596 [Glycine max]
MASSDHVILRDRTHVPTKRSLLELSSQDALLAQNKLLAKQLESLTETLSKLTTQLQAAQPSHSIVMQVGGCSICGGAHESNCCYQQGENFNQNQGQGWRSHPGNQLNKDQGGPSNRPPNQGPNLYERTTKLEETLAQFMQISMSNHKSTKSAIKNLEIQVGQLAKEITENSSGGFGANTKKNPKEECKVVITTSKRETIVDNECRTNEEKEEALQQMSLYSKFLKDLLAKKGKYIHSDNIVVEGNCSVVIQRFLPPKYKDPGSVTIPCSIGAVSVGKMLINLGASINLMPLSMCRRIGELEILPTRMTLQLADRSITRPYGVMEDVLVKVCQFTFPTDFVIMDIEEDAEIPLILGRPFILIANYVVDMGKGNLEMSVDD